MSRGRSPLGRRSDRELPGGYELLKRLGAGGMAEVFLARQTVGAGVERPVVIKRMLAELAGDPLFVSMFVEEARVAAQLQHPNIVQIYDVVVAGTCPCIVMEYLDGFDVRWLVRRCLDRGNCPVPVAAVAAIGAGAALGLGHAHRKRGLDGAPLGIVHRDISPHNLFVTRDGVVKVLDFGIAKSTSRMTATQEGAIKGKIPYMSPEQVRGEPLDGASDLFSVGVVLWETATGRRLFRRDTVEQAVHAMLAAPIPLPSEVRPELPVRFDEIVVKALARDRTVRYATAEELAQDLEELGQELKAGSSPILLSRLVEWVARPGEQEAHLPPSRIDTEEITARARVPPTKADPDIRSAVPTSYGGFDAQTSTQVDDGAPASFACREPGASASVSGLADPWSTAHGDLDAWLSTRLDDAAPHRRSAVPTVHGGLEAPAQSPPAGAAPEPSDHEARCRPMVDPEAGPHRRAAPSVYGHDFDAAGISGAPLDLAVDVLRERKAQVFREDLDRRSKSLAAFGDTPSLLGAPLYAVRVRRRLAWLRRRETILRRAVEAARTEARQALSALGESVRRSSSGRWELGPLLDEIAQAEREVELREKEVAAGDAEPEDRRLLEAARSALKARLAELGRRALALAIADPADQAAVTARAAEERATDRGRDLELYERARLMFDPAAVRRGWAVLGWGAVIAVAAATGAAYALGFF